MSVSNLSKIELRNASISSIKNISIYEEQKDMLQLLDNQLNVIYIYLYNFSI
jgi:hypothetical protein